MAKYRPYDCNQLMMVPVSLEKQLVPGTLEYAIHHVIEERVDLSIFDEQSGRLICPAGHGLYVRNRNFETAGGFKAIAYQAPKTASRDCAYRSKCLRKPDTVSPQVHVFYGRRPGGLTDDMKRKIDTPDGRANCGKRLGIVEPVSGNIRAQKGMDRFTLPGRAKASIQWLLCCLVHDIERSCILE